MVEPGLAFFLFGLVATIGLAIYDTRNDQLYDELVGRAAEIERTLGLPDGAFAHRPKPWLRVSFSILKTKIDHRTGVGGIYAASIGLWLFGVYLYGTELVLSILLPLIGFTAPSGVNVVSVIYLVAVVLAVLSTVIGLRSIQRQRETREDLMREHAAQAVKVLCWTGPDRAVNDPEFLKACAELSDVALDNIQGRARFYLSLDPDALKHYIPMPLEPKKLAMSHFVALLTDLPPRWIHDCATNRRGTMK